MRYERPMLFLCLAMLLVLSACSDETASEPQPEPDPYLRGTVTDATGAPVEGASITLVFGTDGVGMPGWTDPAKRVKITMKFYLGEPGRAHVWIEDYVGGSVRTLVDGELDAGEHSITWDATDEEGARVPPGLYYFELRFWEDGPESPPAEYTARTMLYEYEPQALIGMPHAVTDAKGRFEIPLALLPLGEEFQATGEGGEDLGIRPISNRVHVYALIENGDGIEFVDRYVRVENRTYAVQVNLQLP